LFVPEWKISVSTRLVTLLGFACFDWTTIIVYYFPSKLKNYSKNYTPFLIKASLVNVKVLAEIASKKVVG